jgi:undecaprenyl-diphosphatase
MNVGGILKQADDNLLFLINKKLAFHQLDNLMLIIREAYTWIPLYFFFLLFFYSNCRKYLLPIVVLSVLTFAITDFTSASILKPFFERLRPCRDPSLQFTLNNIAGCGGIYGMPSSHASNHFGLATFWFLVIKNTLERKWYWLWIWAFVICYAQVYVGVHFPGDVVTGGVVGILTGLFTFYVFRRWTTSIDNVVKN